VNATARGEESRVVVQSTSNQTWQLDVSVAGLTASPVFRNGQTCSDLELPGETLTDIRDLAALPAISRLMGLRTQGNPMLEVVSEEWSDVEGTYTLAAAEESASTNFRTAQDAYLPETAVALSARQVMGGVPLANVQITAVKYNAAQHKIRVLRRMTVQVHENGAPAAYPRGITETIAEVLRPALSNWAEMALDELVVRGTLLYITADGTVAPQQIAPLIQWRTRKGYRVEVAGPAQIGTPMSTSNVKAYIQSRYNNADPPLEFVCMVGDGNGTYLVPSYVYHAPDEAGVFGVGDFGFTQLDGTDLLPDVAIGRLFFTSSPELLTQVNKTLRYEMTPAPRATGSHPNWFKAAAVVGDYDNQALSVSHIQTMRWVRERMLDAGYTGSSIDTLYWTDYSARIPTSTIIASINSGASLWCYRGWNRMNNFPVADLGGLNNIGDWPFMLNMTCNTNDYNQSDVPCLGEAFMVPTATPSNPAGAIGFVGMSSGGTHSRYNNIQMGGAVQGLLREGVRTTGATLMRAKLEMYRNFPLTSDSAEVNFFCGITTLLGDPAVDVYTNTPDTLLVTTPASVPAGTNSLTLTVTRQGGVAVDSAYVNVVKGTEVFAGGYTAANGGITLNFATTTADSMFVVVSKHNCVAAYRSVMVTASSQYVSPASATVALDDDNNGTSHGNGDGLANPGETIEVAPSLKNWGSTAVSGVTAVLSTNDPYITSVVDNTETYGTIAAGATASPTDDFDFAVAAYAPSGHVVQFTLTVTDGASHTWTSTIPVTLSNAQLSHVSSTLTGSGNGILDPGESAQLAVTLLNSGTRALAAGRIGYLHTDNRDVTITDSIGTFAALGANGQGSNSANTFGISATAHSLPGERIPLTCIFPIADGFADTVRFSLTIGTVAANTPTPADGYGYWAFDNTDTAYEKHPTYNWVEVDPDSGGLGTQQPLVDAADGNDASMVVDLPFSFRYYGQTFNQITVCSNGWLAMGGDQVSHTDFRNYDIPSAICATGLIAPFWDDLRTSQPEGALAAQGHRPDHALDEGGASCAASVVINSLPYTDTGFTCDNHNVCGRNGPDVFYRYDVPAGGQELTISLCGSQFDTYLSVASVCCSTAIATNHSGCGGGFGSAITRVFDGGPIYIRVDGYQGQSCGNYEISVTTPTPETGPGHLCTYYDAANHRFIVEWSGVYKYNAMDNPRETFECILYQPGYPATPTGDGEILFQYRDISNVADVAASNDYCTVGIENLDQTDGVLYSFFNRVSPIIAGAAPLTSGRAILFTTSSQPPAAPQAPAGLAAFGTPSSVILRWRAVTADVTGNPLQNVQYNIYRGTVGEFTPATGTLIATVSDTTYTDNVGTAVKYYYIVQTVANGASSEIVQPHLLSK
jgi:hypothetical protein